jgi:hypothetical protein
MTWMENVDSHRGQTAQLRHAIRADFAEFREAMRGDFAELRQEVRAEITGLRQEIRGVDAKLSGDIKQAKFELITWSFVFWVGAVASIAALAGVLR